MNTPVRMMIYTQDSYGLGHLRRATNLANALVAKRKDLTILMVVDSPVAPFFELSERIDFVKLPTLIRVHSGVFRAESLSIDYECIYKMRSEVITGILQHFQPHLMLVDHRPGGANNELLAALEMAKQQKLDTKFVLGLRDIIDDPKITRALWKKERVYDTLEGYYDAVIIYGSPEYFSTADEYCIPRTERKRVHYCGYICNTAPAQEPLAIRSRLGIGDRPLVTVMAGGGADAFRLMSTFLDCLECDGISRIFSSVIVTGPFLPAAQSKIIQERSKMLGVSVYKTIHDTISHVNASDLIISMAGYNTLSEILRLQKPALVIPRSGSSAEQMIRATIFAQRGLIRALDPQDCSSEQLLREILEMLSSRSSSALRDFPKMDGVEKATEILLDLLPN